MKDVQIEISQEVLTLETIEPSDFVYHHFGSINLINGETDQSTEIGTVEFYYANLGEAMNCGVHAYEVFDAKAQSLADIYDAIFDEGGEFRDALSRVTGDISESNVLILSSLEIVPKWRRKELGLLVLQSIMRRFGVGCSLVVLKPFPLQFEGVFGIRSGDIDNPQLRGEIQSATEKLQHYYSRLGFKAVPNSNILALNLDKIQSTIPIKDDWM
ncbi:MAG: hypothetical protein WD049_00285 [Candidatus Paceibacterota bacterium]